MSLVGTRPPTVDEWEQYELHHRSRMSINTIIGIERTDSIKELAELYTVASVFVNPTYEDNYPTTNLEALACGTPVLTYRTGGSVEAAGSEYGKIVDQGKRYDNPDIYSAYGRQSCFQ